MATTRQWAARFLPDRHVELRHVLVLAPGEDAVDTPETTVLTLAEWAVQHTDFGLTADGRQIADAQADRAARIRLRQKAQADPDFAALLRLLRVDPSAADPPPDSGP